MLAALHEISIPVAGSSAKRSSIPPEDEPKTVVDERTSPTPAPPTPPAILESPLRRHDSKESVPSSVSSENRGSRREESENGTETEEDEGMVLVGRPH
jgi:hypothetical protein